MTSTPARVAIALPVYNASATIAQALESALAQTYEDIEIVVSDNASTDDTVEVVRGYDDPRIRLHRNRVNVGYHGNMNGSIALCRSPFVKFLHADDALYPRCIERMVEVMERSENVGLVFSRRAIDVPADAGPGYQTFREVFEHAYRGFGELAVVNDGHALLRRWLEDGLTVNWVGEPSNVMMRRSALQSLGLFNPRMRMLDDLDMWARAMARYDIGFVDEELSVYRFHPNNLTIQQSVSSRWFDMLWTLEGLASDPALVAEFPALKPALARERRQVARRLARTARRDPKRLGSRLRVVGGYAAFRVRRSLGRGAPLHPPLAAA
jgi:glycosyltransferase involved in cell wall biosynthesis